MDKEDKHLVISLTATIETLSSRIQDLIETIGRLNNLMSEKSRRDR